MRSQNVDGVGRVEVRSGHLVGGEEELTGDPGPARAERGEHERGGVVGRQRQQQVGVDELALVPYPLLVGEVRERRPVRRPRLGEGPRPLAMGHPVLPVEVPTTTEGRDQVAQLGVDGSAVVALVVVLGDDLPVGGDVVRPRPHRGAGRPAGSAAAARGWRPAARSEAPPPPGSGARRPTRPTIRPRPDGGRRPRLHPVHERRAPQPPVEAVGPGVVRAADAAREMAGTRAHRRGQGRRAWSPGAGTRCRTPAARRRRGPRGRTRRPRRPPRSHRNRATSSLPGDREPLVGEDPFPLALPDRVVDVRRPGQRPLES